MGGIGLSIGGFRGTLYECKRADGPGEVRLLSSVALLALFDLDEVGGIPGGGPGSGIPGCHPRLREDDLESVASLLEH